MKTTRILTALAAALAALTLTAAPALADDARTDQEVVAFVEGCDEMTCAGGIDAATAQRYCTTTEGGGPGYEDWCVAMTSIEPETSEPTEATVDPFEGVMTEDLTDEQVVAMTESGAIRDDAVARYCEITDGGNADFDAICEALPTETLEPTAVTETDTPASGTEAASSNDQGFPTWLLALIGGGLVGCAVTTVRRRKPVTGEEA